MEKNKKAVASAFEWLDSLVFAIILIITLFTFVFQIFFVEGRSMLPTLSDGSRVFVLSAFYTPKQGDVIIVDAEEKINESIIKRIVATENQTVDIDRESGEITVDGIVFDTPIPTSTANLLGSADYPVTVPRGSVFVMGDNRSDSLDSRYAVIGFIDNDSIIGHACYIVSPLNKIGKLA